MDTREQLIKWLRDAYAMERGLEVTLKKQSENENLPPALRHQCTVHLGETTAHAQAIEECLLELGSDAPSLKTGISQGMAMAQGVATALAHDEHIKDLLTAYSSEHFEIACYEALRAGAEPLEETSVVELCDSILQDEEAMAAWLRDHLPVAIRDYFERESLAEA